MNNLIDDSRLSKPSCACSFQRFKECVVQNAWMNLLWRIAVGSPVSRYLLIASNYDTYNVVACSFQHSFSCFVELRQHEVDASWHRADVVHTHW